METSLKLRPLKDLKISECVKIPACAIKTSDISIVAADKRLLDYSTDLAAIESAIATHSTTIDNLRTELNIKYKYLQIGECSREEIAEIECKITELSDAVTSLQKDRTDKRRALPILQSRIDAAHARLYDSEIVDVQHDYETQFSMLLGVAFTLQQQMEFIAPLFNRLYRNEVKETKEAGNGHAPFRNVPFDLAISAVKESLIRAAAYMPREARDILRREGK